MKQSKDPSASRRLLAGLGACALSLFAFNGCSGGSKGDPDNRGDFKVTLVSTGRGQIYPYRIRTVDSFGNPTSTVINIEDDETLKQNVNGNNGVLPVATFDPAAILPDGSPGNHFLFFEFSHKLDVTSILSDLLANQTNSGLTTAISILAYDPVTEATVTLQGRGFVGGFTYVNQGGQLVLVKAVEENGDNVTILDPVANGFPSYAGANALVGPKAFTFVADSDSNLSTLETFPANRLIRLVISNAVLDSEGAILEQEVCTATTVGNDPNPPEVLGFSPSRNPEITPGNGMTGVDPTTQILVRFNKPVQPGDVGQFFDPNVFTPPAGGVTLSVTAAAQTFNVIYHADPLSFGDLCNYRLTPAYNLPGDSVVTVTVQNTSIRGLTGMLLGNVVSTNFRTGLGPGVINAPVAPEAMYIGIGGDQPGVSVLDLNGFGQGTGDITNTRFPLNPNIGVPGVFPPLSPGTSNLDAGSAGVLTLTQDTTGETRLLRDPLVGSVVDIQIGAPLDLVFNNENINVNAGRANQTNPLVGIQQPGNTITQPPHPNPPRLIFPPPNPNRAIFGEEPTTTSSTGPPGNILAPNPPCALSPVNQLVQGNPFSNNQGELGIYGTFFTGTFYGPQAPPLSPPPPPVFCPFTSRQQIGHFLYVLDRDNRRVLVVNSNRFTVLDSIRMSDPVTMAMAPNMSRLAVSNFTSSRVSFIDINPLSQTFNQVVAETLVERGPTGIAWQPDGEDVLVVSSGANAMSIISAQDFTVRRTVTGFLTNPIEVAVTPRFVTTGFQQAVYYAYVLNSNGTVAVYESGPDGVNGIGFNDIIGTVPNATFARARTIIYDYASQNGAVLIGHVDENGLGQVSRLDLTTAPIGAQPLNPNSGGFILPPTFRQKEWSITTRFGGINPSVPGGDLLSGNSVIDIALDDMFNVGGLPGQVTQFNSSVNTVPFGHSGKEALKLQGGAAVPVVIPKLMFVALSDVGRVDVFEVENGRKVGSIRVPGVRAVAGYWRQ